MCAGRRISFERRSDRAPWAIACLVLVGFALAGIGVRLAAPAAEEVRDLERQLAALLPQTDIDEDNYVLAPYDELVVVGPPSATSHWSGVQADGTVPLGGDHQFGRVHVAGMQLDEAASAISAHLAQYFDEEPVTVTLGRNRSKTTFFVNCGRNWWLCQIPYEQAQGDPGTASEARRTRPFGPIGRDIPHVRLPLRIPDGRPASVSHPGYGAGG